VQCVNWRCQLSYPYERITCLCDAACWVLLAFLCRSHDSVVYNTFVVSRQKFETDLMDAYLTLHIQVCAFLLFISWSNYFFGSIHAISASVNHTNYNRIKLLEFCLHISAELLLLSKKVIYLLTSAFDVFHGLPCLSPFFHPVFCSSFAISLVTGWMIMDPSLAVQYRPACIENWAEPVLCWGVSCLLDFYLGKQNIILNDIKLNIGGVDFNSIVLHYWVTVRACQLGGL